MVEAHRIAEKLWIGSAPCELAPPHLLQPFAAVLLCAQEIQGLALPVRTVGVPMDDAGRPPNDEELSRALGAAELAHNMTARGHRVLVTCAMGVNRSSFVTALVLLRRGYDADAAIALIRKRRVPPSGMKPLSNPYFVETLRAIDRA